MKYPANDASDNLISITADVSPNGAAKIECSRNDVVDLEVGDKYQYTFEFKRIFYALILMILTMFGTSCAKENTFINTEYKDLEIHGDYIINEIGTVGNAYYYSYYSEDESRCHICRFDLISNELREIKAFDTKQLDRIVVVENGYEKIFLDLEEYVIFHNKKCYNSELNVLTELKLLDLPYMKGKFIMPTKIIMDMYQYSILVQVR